MNSETDVRPRGFVASWSRIAAVVLVLLATVLAGLVILGMATGTDRQTDKGVVLLWEVIVTEVVGAMSLLALIGLGRACLRLWRGQKGSLVRWTLLAVPLWLFWAMLRIGEYSS